MTKHARERMQERFGIELTPALEADLLERIRTRRALVERNQKADNVTVYKTTVEGKVLRIVFSHRAQKILTVTQSRLLTFKPKDPQ